MLEGISKSLEGVFWVPSKLDGFAYKQGDFLSREKIQLDKDSPEQYKRVYGYEKTITRAASWSDLSNIEIPYPIGYFSERNKQEYPRVTSSFYYNDKSEEDFRSGLKFYGIFPLVGFVVGGWQIGQATNRIFKRVITDDNQFETLTLKKNWDGSFYSKKLITKLELSLLQKGAILMLSLATYVRGIVTFCQLGIIFAPFDFAANMIARGFKKA